MSDLSAAANIRPPHGYGSGESGETKKCDVLVASSAATAIGPTKNDKNVFFTFVSSVDAYIRFGDDQVGAATTDDWPLKADIEKTYRLKPRDRYFRVIRKTGDGVLKWSESEG